MRQRPVREIEGDMRMELKKLIRRQITMLEAINAQFLFHILDLDLRLKEISKL